MRSSSVAHVRIESSKCGFALQSHTQDGSRAMSKEQILEIGFFSGKVILLDIFGV